MTINFKVPEIKELKPRILVLGVGGAGAVSYTHLTLPTSG